jgi:hypothetical protein
MSGSATAARDAGALAHLDEGEVEAVLLGAQLLVDHGQHHLVVACAWLRGVRGSARSSGGAAQLAVLRTDSLIVVEVGGVDVGPHLFLLNVGPHLTQDLRKHVRVQAMCASTLPPARTATNTQYSPP